MQSTSVIAIIAATLPATQAQQGPLPKVLEALVFIDGQRAGCLNGYGKFTNNAQWCYPLVTTVNTLPYSRVKGYEYCGILPSGVLSCYLNGGLQDEFQLLAPDMALRNATSAIWSTDVLPEDQDTIGVEIYPNADHATQLYLQTHSIQG